MPDKREYSELVKAKSPNSPIWKNMIWAFLVGGAICTLGELINTLLVSELSLDLDAAAAWTSISLIFLGALLTALDIYYRIAKHAGAGTLIPITGFANSVASPAMEFRTEGIITGMCAKMLVVAGPVIVYGTVGSVIYGAIYYWFLR